MSGLGNYPFLKMNGLGNEIVILDLRGSTHVVTEAEARGVQPKASVPSTTITSRVSSISVRSVVRVSR